MVLGVVGVALLCSSFVCCRFCWERCFSSLKCCFGTQINGETWRRDLMSFQDLPHPTWFHQKIKMYLEKEVVLIVVVCCCKWWCCCFRRRCYIVAAKIQVVLDFNKLMIDISTVSPFSIQVPNRSSEILPVFRLWNCLFYLSSTKLDQHVWPSR